MNQEELYDHMLLFILKPSAFRRNRFNTKYFSGILLAVYVVDVAVCYLIMNENCSILCEVKMVCICMRGRMGGAQDNYHMKSEYCAFFINCIDGCFEAFLF